MDEPLGMRVLNVLHSFGPYTIWMTLSLTQTQVIFWYERYFLIVSQECGKVFMLYFVISLVNNLYRLRYGILLKPEKIGRQFADIISKAYSLKTVFIFWLKFHWSWFTKVQLIMSLGFIRSGLIELRQQVLIARWDTKLWLIPTVA